MNSKADYVRAQKQTRDHHCHWPGCAKQVPPAKTPSRDYVVAARAAQDWIKANAGPDLFGDPR